MALELIFFAQYDIDIIIEKKDIELDALRSLIVERDNRFAQVGLKFYFIQVRRVLPKVRLFYKCFFFCPGVKSSSRERAARIPFQEQRAYRDTTCRLSWSPLSRRAYIYNS
jgi:hypothetical protein